MKRVILCLGLLLAAPLPAAEKVTAEVLLARMAAGESLLVLDVRSADEYAAGHVPGAINVPHGELTPAHDAVRAWKERPVVVYCRSGRRSAIAIEALEKGGFSRVQHLEGDMLGWEAQQRELVRLP